ncbi:uncharacterized protein LOC110729434 [Chenopodium quinoa]|uniref:uncharacterized protein LOC110729434 n=1 Tax=Chenopodium quinoa TaxID=63459 RepID=UPI000B76EBD3|nr:uncharacterized protein LOC110729434 [Chenopodium quinoa]
MSDLGPLSYFLGIFVTRTPSYMLLSQKKYAQEILERAGMGDCKSAAAHVEVKSKLSLIPVRLFGILLNTVVLQGTIDHGLHLYSSATTRLITYTDADWTGYQDTRRSTFGYCCFLGDNLISWSSKHQHTLSKSSAEAEYQGVANVVSEACWLRNLLLELHCPLRQTTLVYCDNISAIYLSTNPVQHQCTKHVELDLDFVREKVALGQVRVLHVPSRYQFADIFTKGLPRDLFLDFRSNLTVRPPPAMTAGV